jgi:hypothetical protein
MDLAKYIYIPITGSNKYESIPNIFTRYDLNETWKEKCLVLSVQINGARTNQNFHTRSGLFFCFCFVV